MGMLINGAVNGRDYDDISNGVYKSGFTSQEAHEEAAVAVFETLDWMEERLGRQHYVAGDH